MRISGNMQTLLLMTYSAENRLCVCVCVHVRAWIHASEGQFSICEDIFGNWGHFFNPLYFKGMRNGLRLVSGEDWIKVGIRARYFILMVWDRSIMWLEVLVDRSSQLERTVWGLKQGFNLLLELELLIWNKLHHSLLNDHDLQWFTDIFYYLCCSLYIHRIFWSITFQKY